MEQNLFQILLDIYFNEDVLRKTISDFQVKSKGASKWLLYSDYCLDDKTKPNDVITFALMPFVSEEHYLGMQKTIADLQPKDIKHAREVNTEFLHLLKNEAIVMFSFILDDRKSFFGTTHAAKVACIKASLQSIADGYKQWCDTAANEDVLMYYQESVKKLGSKIAYLNDAKVPNVKLLADILLTAYVGAYISYKMLEDVPVEIFGWFSDRDKVISGEYNIIVPIFNFFLYNMWRGKKQYQFCTMTPDQTIVPFYEEFNRMVDVVTGAIADYDLKANLISADKFDTVLTEYCADNEWLKVFRYFMDGSNLRLAKEVIHKKP